MGFKIVFSYDDGSRTTVSNHTQKLTKKLAKFYQDRWARPANDGGMVYTTPIRTCTPVPLAEYIEKAN